MKDKAPFRSCFHFKGELWMKNVEVNYVNDAGHSILSASFRSCPIDF